jgi:DNA-binding NtrC family response regulator
LRERKEDIPLLADHFLKRFAAKARKPIDGYTEGAMDKLMAHEYPGNVRELENMIERAILLATKNSITHEEITSEMGALREEPASMSLADHEKVFILDILEKMDGNRRRTAEALGISLRALQYRLKEWGVIKRR